MAEDLSWVGLVKDARYLQEHLENSGFEARKATKDFVTSLVMQELQHVQPELRRGLSRNRLSIKMPYPTDLARDLRQEFLMRLNHKLPSPFYAVHSIKNKGIDYIIGWAMLPTE